MRKRIVLITGGTSGIGLAAAKLFASRGAYPVISGRSARRGADALEELDGKADFLAADVRHPKECEALVTRTVEKYGTLDVLINSAGVYLERPAEDLTEEDYYEVMDTNIKGTMFMSKFALGHLSRARGNIVNVSSDAGLHGNIGCSLYCASKGAVTLYTRALALEAARLSVRVNCVCPGDVLTPMTARQLALSPSYDEALAAMSSVYPMGRIGTAEEAARAIVFLASDEASFITGAALAVDGGLTA